MNGGTIGALTGGGIVLLVGMVVLGMWGCPAYNVYSSEKAGEAQYKQAEQNRRVRVLEAQAKLEAATLEAKAEVERAKGIAGANSIIADGLKGNEVYLRYLWIDKVAGQSSREIVYIPTEANLPILEAQRTHQHETVVVPPPAH